MTRNESSDENADSEIIAIGRVYATLKDLEVTAQQRVLDYVARKLNLTSINIRNNEHESRPGDGDSPKSSERDEAEFSTPGESDGINPIAQRWIKRSGLSGADLSSIFSIGGEEIDLVAKKVPGETKKERMRSVLLLKSIASYLASGAARTGHTEAKEACVHYDGWDATNFSTYLKSFASEIGGSKAAGYTLNARGLSSATELIRAMIASKTG